MLAVACWSLDPPVYLRFLSFPWKGKIRLEGPLDQMYEFAVICWTAAAGGITTLVFTRTTYSTNLDGVLILPRVEFTVLEYLNHHCLAFPVLFQIKVEQ